MNIKRVEISKIIIPSAKPLKASLGKILGAENVIIKIITENETCGWGEASPFSFITGDTIETSYETAKKLAQVIKGKDALAIEQRMNEINLFIIGQPSIRSAFDMALYDIAAKSAGMPLYKFLGGERREIRTDLTIGWYDTVEETIEAAQDILDAGFDAIKMKVGRPRLQDLPHVEAVRKLVGPLVHLKLDSNQGWDYPEAVANLNAMKNLNIQYSEQPLAVWDFDGLARLRRKVDTPICADESIFDHHDALKLIKLDAVDYLNIKLGKAGGITTGLKINAIAEAAGAKCMIGCFGESRLGLSASAHLAMARPNIVFLDLDAPYHFKEDPVIGGVEYDKNIGGLLHLPDTPGIGAEIDELYLEKGSKVVI